MLLKIALAPVLVAQGRWVRARALKLSEAAGPRQGVAGRGHPQWRVLVLGDSSGAGVGVPHQRHALAQPLAEALSRRLGVPIGWQLVATTGHTTGDALQALRHAALRPADLLVTALGVNDTVGQVSPRRWLAQLDAVVALAAHRVGVRFALHSGLPPMHRFPLLPQPLRAVLGADARRLDRALQAHLAGRTDRLHVPLPEVAGALHDGWVAEDGFHPGPRGYLAWAERLAEVAGPLLAAEVSVGAQPLGTGRGLPCASIAT
jgi:lysophospholipase L1-like esterase